MEHVHQSTQRRRCVRRSWASSGRQPRIKCGACKYQGDERLPTIRAAMRGVRLVAQVVQGVAGKLALLLAGGAASAVLSRHDGLAHRVMTMAEGAKAAPAALGVTAQLLPTLDARENELGVLRAIIE